MKTATVIYPGEAAFEIEVEASDDIALDLGQVWVETQGDFPNNQLNQKRKRGDKLRSSMVGDVIIHHGRYFIIDNLGWVEIDKEFYPHYASIEQRDRIMGFDWLQKHNLFNLFIQRIS